MMSHNDITRSFAPVLFVILWSSGFIGAKFGLPYAEPLTFLAIRMACVVALLAAIAFIWRPTWPKQGEWLNSAIAGVLIHGLYLGGVFTAIHLGMSAGLSSLIVSLQPVLTSTVANRWLGERVNGWQWLGFVLGLAGVYLVVHDKVSFGETPPRALLATCIALAGITVGTLYQKRHNIAIDWRAGLLVQYAAAGALFAIGAALFETRTVEWTPQFVFALAWLVLVLSFGAVWLLFFLVRKSAATRVTSLFYLVPPVTALMAFVLFGERLSGVALLGMAICVLGVFLVNWAAAGNSDGRQ